MLNEEELRMLEDEKLAKLFAVEQVIEKKEFE